VQHIDSILRAAHLIPVYGSESDFIPETNFDSTDSLDTFYVSKYADYPAHEIVF
ncbi:hypothetical protein GGX14DRAFT_371962, partial [Mycena pura]